MSDRNGRSRRCRFRLSAFQARGGVASIPGVLHHRLAATSFTPWTTSRERVASSATRLPKSFAVSRSPDRGASSGEASDGDTASAPANPAVQFTSAGTFAFILAGSRAVPIQTCPCCCDSVQKYWIVEYLSPLIEAEFVNPAASLSFHLRAKNALAELSANFLNCQAGPPIYVGLPKMIASANPTRRLEGLQIH